MSDKKVVFMKIKEKDVMMYEVILWMCEGRYVLHEVRMKEDIYCCMR